MTKLGTRLVFQLIAVWLSFDTSGAWAAEPESRPDPAVWGVYARLVGTDWKGENDSASWRWMPDQSIVETRGVLQSSVIRTGAKPGELVSVYGNTGLHTFDGRVGVDGSVIWIRRGRFMKMPSRVSLVDGQYMEEAIKLDDANQVASVTRSARFQQVGGVAVQGGGVSSPSNADSRGSQMPPATSQPASALAKNATPSINSTAAPAPREARVAAEPPYPEWLEARVGQSFVGTSPSGAQYTMDVYREGSAIALHLGTLGGARGGRILIRPTGMAGRFDVVENWHGTSNENAVAYIAGSGGAPGDPLDGYYADPRDPGDLVVSYDIKGGYLVITFNPDNANGGISYNQNGGKRTFGLRRSVGDLDYVDLAWFSPASPEAAQQVLAYSAAQRQRQEQERREEELDRAEQQQRVASAAYESLVRANAEAAQSEARSRAALDATLDQAARQAAFERQRTPPAPAWNAQEVQNARAATERQEAIARSYAAQQRQSAAVSNSPAVTAPARPAPSSTSTRDRADNCVGQPVTATHKCASSSGLTGRVVNSCAVSVDVRMCFMTATGWSCQSNYGLAPERAWEPGDCKATGQVFRSVRYSDSKEPLDSP